MLSLTQRLGSLVQPLLGQACRELRQQRLLNIHEYQVSAQSGLRHTMFACLDALANFACMAQKSWRAVDGQVWHRI